MMCSGVDRDSCVRATNFRPVSDRAGEDSFDLLEGELTNGILLIHDNGDHVPSGNVLDEGFTFGFELIDFLLLYLAAGHSDVGSAGVEV